MVTRSAQKSRAADRLSTGWVALALAVLCSLLVAEYMGPVIGIASATTSCGFVMLCGVRTPLPRFPAAGYWLAALLAVGAATAVVANLLGASPQDIDLQRDIGILLSYLLFLLIGYLFASSRVTFLLLLSAIITAGLLISLVHLVKLTSVLASGVTDLYLFRLDAGRGSVTQFVALCACVLLLSVIDGRILRRFIIGCAALLAISMLITLSRGLMLALMVLVLGTLGVVFDRAGRISVDPTKLLLAVGAAAAVVAAVYYAIVAFLPTVHVFIDEFFITRVVNSVTEVSATDFETRTQIADNYRAFEVAHTMFQFGQQPLYAQLTGQGWGSTVRFGVETASTKSSFTRTEASFLHNGYAYFLMKTGVAGVLLYAGFLVHHVARAVDSTLWPADPLSLAQRKLLLVLVFALGLGTVTTGGFGFPATYLGLAALLGACYGPLWSTDGAPDRPTVHAPTERRHA